MKRRALKLLSATTGRPKLDRYELIAELAAGGMATVFLARIGGAGGFQRFVAIKRLHPHLAHEHDFVDMFLDEARLAAGIHHPNVVPILEVGESAAGYYQVMEYIEGETLANVDRAAREVGRPPLPVLLRISVDALLGLHAAHERKDEQGNLVHLVHRDVSPQNILVGVDGTSRITDFGVARATTRLSSTRSGDLKGKLAYMAPEQVLGDADLDRRADTFAMGVVVWELLTGESLFRGANDAATMHRVLREDIPDVRAKSPDVPAAVAEVIARSLQRDRTLRYATASDFAEALRVTGIPLATEPEVASYVQIVLGTAIAERRDAVRAWLSATADESQVSGPRSPEKFIDSPTLEMERPPLPELNGVGGETAGASVVTSGGTSSGARPRPDSGSAVPLILIAITLLFVAGLGIFRITRGGDPPRAATDLPAPSASSPVAAAVPAEPAAASFAPVASAAPSAREPATTAPATFPATTKSGAPVSGAPGSGGTGKRPPSGGHREKPPTDLAASPY